MTSDDIRLYLEDNTDLSDEVISIITPQILDQLNYQPMYLQIDVLAHQLTNDLDKVSSVITSSSTLSCSSTLTTSTAKDS